MELNVGDVVEFKKYEDMSFDETVLVSKDELPKSGKVRKIIFGNEKVLYFFIEGSQCGFSAESVARVISDDVDINSLKPGDEVLMKVTIGRINEDHIRTLWVNNNKKDVVKILKHKEPERFIVQENYYGMYIGWTRKLVSDKSEAKIYTSGNIANSDAVDMHLNSWDVIPYDD